MTVFEFDDYRGFLKAQIANNKLVRGYQSQLAKAARCQSSFLSQVLANSMDLGYDHAADLAQFWRLEEEETEYFVLLVAQARAQSTRYKKLIKGRLQSLKKDNLNITKTVKQEGIEKGEFETLYYSSWIWSAIHIMAGTPEFNTAKTMSSRLKLPLSLVEISLTKLEKMGLVTKQENGAWRVTKRNIHLSDASLMTQMNHYNWCHVFSKWERV